MGSTERRAREKEEMRARITGAAMRLFLAEGFEKTSIRRIAEAIEYTPGAIYSYFEDKDAILFALHDDGMERLHAALSPCEAIADPADALAAACRAYVGFAMKNPEYYDLMFVMEATGNKIQESGDWVGGLKNYDVLRRVVYRGMRAGVVPPGNPEVVAFALWSFVHGMVTLQIKRRCPMIPDEAKPMMLEGAASWVIEALRGASTGEPVAVPEFVPMASLTPEGIHHLRAFEAPPPPAAPRKKRRARP